MSNKSSVVLFIDDDTTPYGTFQVPINFELDTRKLVDGDHLLKIVSKGPDGKEGIRKIPFIVRNGPAIAIEGLAENEIVDGIIPIMINAYGKGDQKKFLIEGSETPHSIPAWLWVVIIGFVGWAIFYAVTSMKTGL
ncbi:cytochrome C [Flavobacterium sp.]|uniref:cytochrome C n=1 Tax=Flavobacterium sp. TaxID=239 RepID=UPI0026096099|nr:cytochrome C [Flavobacterium sp.]